MAAWTIDAWLFHAFTEALAKEPRAATASTRNLALGLVTLAVRVCEVARAPHLLPVILTSALPVVEPDEEKAVASVREAYAASHRVLQRKAAGLS